MAINKKVIDDYKIIRKLGYGGMATVYLGENPNKKPSKVAIKVLDETLNYDDKYKERFKREALISSKLVGHPTVVKIYKYDFRDNCQYIIMEYVDGKDLGYYMKTRKRFTPDGVVKILLMIGSSLSLAHKKGIIHRDIKPQNIILGSNGLVKVTDFGIAKVYGLSSLTLRDENVMGTLFYMAPEQIKGENIDQRTDIYALGIVAYELLIGITPYASENTWEIINGHLHKVPRPIKKIRKNIPDYLVSVINKCIEKEKSNRFRNVDELIMALKRKEVQEVEVNKEAFLVCKEGDETFPLRYKEVYIGRKELNHIGIKDMYISRRHAKIIMERNRYRIEDLDSRNGTFVNDNKIKSQILNDGDIIRLGQSFLRFNIS